MPLAQCVMYSQRETTTRAHQDACDEIDGVFHRRDERMNGRHLRSVVLAYLKARDMARLPFRVRSRTEHSYGSQRHYLTVEYPDRGETYPYERNYVEVPDHFTEDLGALVEEWYQKHESLLRVSETSQYRGHRMRETSSYSGWRVVPDPWFSYNA